MTSKDTVIMNDRESIERAVVTGEELEFEVEYHRSLTARIRKVQGYIEDVGGMLDSLSLTLKVLTAATEELAEVWQGPSAK